jgi:hypothetical protein
MIVTGLLKDQLIKRLLMAGVLTAIMITALLLPRWLALNHSVTIDEPRWLMRSANFYQALHQGNFGATFQREHPGVLTMWLGTAGFIRRLPGYVDIRDTPINRAETLQTFLKHANITVLDMLVAGRKFVVVGIVGISGLAFLYTLGLIGPIPALLGFLFISFDPFIISLSRLLHLDGLLSALMLLSIVAFLYYLSCSQNPLHLVVSAVAAGLGWLTKSPALFLIPFIILVALADCIAKRITTRLEKKAVMRELWHLALRLSGWFALALLVFVLLWPAMWVDPIGSIQKIFSQAVDYAVEGNRNVTFFDGQIYDSGESAWYFYPVAYVWRVTPSVFLGLLLSVLPLGFTRQLHVTDNQRKVILVLALFSFLFTVFTSLSLKKSDRYLVPIFAPLDIVAALGWFALLQLALRRLWAKRSVLFKYLFTFALLILALAAPILGVLQTYPYYYSYFNPLFGGIEAAQHVMMIGWGEGLDQAARYLNTLPKANTLRVISWYSEGCFSFFFKGKALGMDVDTTLDELRNADYVVLYIHQWQRQMPSPEILAYFEQLTPVHIVQINDFEYAWVYDMHNGSAVARP